MLQHSPNPDLSKEIDDLIASYQELIKTYEYAISEFDSLDHEYTDILVDLDKRLEKIEHDLATPATAQLAPA